MMASTSPKPVPPLALKQQQLQPTGTTAQQQQPTTPKQHHHHQQSTTQQSTTTHSPLILRSKQIAESCFEFLHIEVVDYFLRTTPYTPTNSNPITTTPPNNTTTTENNNSNNKPTKIYNKNNKFYDEVITNDTIFYKLEKLGYSVGQKLAERYTTELHFNDTVDCLKFICKDFWISLFSKQIDSLRFYSAKGVYVLNDAKFKPLTRFSSDSESVAVTKELASLYVIYPCGIVRGMLTSLGVPCHVTADIQNLPATTFTIHLKMKTQPTLKTSASENPTPKEK